MISCLPYLLFIYLGIIKNKHSMIELQILFQLEKLYGKVMTLEQALEAMGRVICTRETLEEEGHEFNEKDLINEIGDEVLNEK